MIVKTLIIFLMMMLSNLLCGQIVDSLDDNVTVGIEEGDIFTDFNEDIESAEMIEDERYYRYGRFFSFYMTMGLTTFDGNRGTAYKNHPPSYGLGIKYFMDFQSSYGIGFSFSKHHFYIDDEVEGFKDPIFIDVSLLRLYFSYSYYIDTSDLGAAITYANPYFISRMEYWYLTNKYPDREDQPNDTGGSLGMGIGFGMEFPIKLKKSYLGVEFLWHTVNFHDKYTTTYRPVTPGGFGYHDLSGNVFTSMVSYIINW